MSLENKMYRKNSFSQNEVKTKTNIRRKFKKIYNKIVQIDWGQIYKSQFLITFYIGLIDVFLLAFYKLGFENQISQEFAYNFFKIFLYPIITNLVIFGFAACVFIFVVMFNLIIKESIEIFKAFWSNK
jgi:hypothetical protein